MDVALGIDRLSASGPSVATVGTFDGIHLGHRKLISRVIEISRQKGFISTLLTFDPHPKAVVAQKGPEKLQLLTNLDEKLGILEQLGLERVVVIKFTREFSELSYQTFVRKVLIDKLNTKVLIVGHDHAFGKDRTGNIGALKKMSVGLGFQLEEVGPFTIGGRTVSSTIIRRLIAEGAVEEAGNMLGSAYVISGVVTRGDGRGRRLSYPTANLSLSNHSKLVPKGGVYAVDCHLRDLTIRGMANIGYKPTFGGINKTLEVHLIGFDGDIYGDRLKIEFLKRLRDEIKFNSEKELIEQLTRDKEQSLKL